MTREPGDATNVIGTGTGKNGKMVAMLGSPPPLYTPPLPGFSSQYPVPF